MVFERVSSSSERPYDATHAEALGSKYVGSEGKPVASQMWKNFEDPGSSLNYNNRVYIPTDPI